MPHALELGIPYASFGKLEHIAVDRFIGDEFLSITHQFIAGCLIGRQIKVGHDLVERIAGVLEVVVLACVDVDILRFCVGNDGQVEVFFLEHLIKPLGPFNRHDFQFNTDLAQLSCNNFTAATGIGWRWQFDYGLEAIWMTSLCEQRLGFFDVKWIGVDQISIVSRVMRGKVSADRCAQTKHSPIDNGLPVDRMSHRLANFNIIKWRLFVVGRKDGLSFG